MNDIFNRDMYLIMVSRFLEKEYGSEVLDVLAEYKNSRNKNRWREIAKESERQDPEYLFRLFTDRVHEFEVIRKNSEALEVLVKRCVHADNFRSFNATDIGMKMICLGDFAVVEGFNPKIKFRRPKTIMAGDECCHFIFEL